MSDWTTTGIPDPPAPAVTPSTPFRDMLAADLASVFFNTDEFAELVTIGVSTGIPVIISFGEGDEYKGSDASDTEGEMRVRVSDMATLVTGLSVTRGAETWTVLDAKKSADNLEWIAVISRLNR